MKLQFKFRDDATTEDRGRVIESLTEDGADQVEPIFPDSDEAALAALYSALVTDHECDRFLDRLRQSDAVEFAEAQPERRVILPIELQEHADGKSNASRQTR
jgi:hypothetical protein